MSEENKALVRRWFAEIDKGNWQIVDNLLAAASFDNNHPRPDLAPGGEGFKRANALLQAAFPDVRHTIEDQIAEGDKVVTRITARATFQGEILGIPPNGKVITIEGIAIHRIAGGQFVEHWAMMDKLGLYQELGVIPPLEETR